MHSSVARPTLTEMLKIRSSLFLYGDRNGVSLNFLAKTTNGIFLSIESLIAADKELPKQMLRYLPESKTLFKRTIANQKQITNARWNAEQHLF
jgi:hypothetical protein